MNSVDFLKDQNILFHSIDEDTAKSIMEREYPCCVLYKYSKLFSPANDLEFSQLYYLAILDEKLRHIVVCRCLEVEQILKTIFIHDAEHTKTKEHLLEDFFSIDGDYLLSHYCSDNIDLFPDVSFDASILDLTFEQFLDVIQFGTFERLLKFFYAMYAKTLYKHDHAPFEYYLHSVRHLRNLSAHNGLLIASLTEKRDISSDRVSSFLGAHGIKNKTLRTNLSKQTMFDLCNLLHLCYIIYPEHKFVDALSCLQRYVELDCTRYASFYSNNSMLASVFSFSKSVVDIYSKLYAHTTPLSNNI